MNAWIKSFLLLVLVFPSFSLFGQTKSQLEEEKRQLVAEIKLATELLEKNKKEKSQVVTQYELIEKQIGARRKLLKRYQQDISRGTRSIKQLKMDISGLEQQKSSLNKAYSSVVQEGYRMKLVQNKWLFLFSAATMQQALNRWRYLRLINKNWSVQVNLIRANKDSLLSKQALLELERKHKQALYTQEQNQKEELDADLSAKDRMLTKLKKNEKRIRKDIEKKDRERRKLNESIRKLIEAEISVAGTGALIPETPASKRLSANFQSNKGQLPWPVSRGMILKTFGKQRHPFLKNVTITNNGIDIRTESGATSKAIFSGEVIASQQIPGYDYMVIIKHGKYYSVYSYLTEILVESGEKVKTSETIGIARSKGGVGEVHLEIWHQKELMDPQVWLKIVD